MSKYIPGNQKHLTLEDCKYKECLSQSRAGINITRHELHQEDIGHHAPDFSGPVSISDYDESSRTRYIRENSIFLP